MLSSKITVDLPSAETDRKMGPLEWVQSIFGTKLELGSGEEELTVSAYFILRGIMSALKSANVSNAISLMVDERLVYMDTENIEHDIDALTIAAGKVSLFKMPFNEMHIALSHEEGDLNTIIDIRIRRSVLLGDPELELRLSGRVRELEIVNGESALAYAERLRIFVSDKTQLSKHQLAFSALTKNIAEALAHHITDAEVLTDAPAIRLIQSSANQIARFRNLKFGNQAEKPQYRPVPSCRRPGAYADPYYYYYYDPYYDYTSWVLIDAFRNEAHWHTEDVRIVSPAGICLYTGTSIPKKESIYLSNSINYDSDGGLLIDDAIPLASGLIGDDLAKDAGWNSAKPASASESEDAWGNSHLNTASEQPGFWNETSSTNSSMGFFGSSGGDSSGDSSCGSSCGGGCGGGGD